jgi:hypothetical protein
MTLARKKLEAVPTEERSVSIPQVEVVQTIIPIIGDEPLLMHRFDEKSRQEMLDKQTGKAQLQRMPKDPADCFRRSLHVVSGRAGEQGAVYGFPAMGFKKAFVEAATDARCKKTNLRRAFFVNGDLVPIEYMELRVHEATVKIPGSADLRFRGELVGWRAELPISYNARAINIETLLLLCNLAGFGVGVGEWRPQRNGNKGRWHVAREGEWQQWRQHQ